MINAFSHFCENIEEIKKNHLTSTGIVVSGTILNFDNIKRSCVVLAVSALDYFIHEIAIWGMVDTFQGNRTPTNKYNKHNISLQGLAMLSAANPASAFENEIRISLGWLSFQMPDKIKAAVALFSNVQLWASVARHMGDTEANVKATLELIVQRRNMIAHEADIEPVFKTKRPINDSTVTDTIEFIEKLGTAIYNVV